MAFEQQLSMVQFEAYDTNSRLIGLTDLELPTLTLKTNDISGAGLLGEYSAPVPGAFESFEIKFKWRTLMISQAELFKHLQHRITCRGSQELQNTGTGAFRQQPVRLEIAGTPKEYNLGKFEPASSTDTEITVEVSRLEIFIDNKRTLLFDRFNYQWVVNNKDEMAQIRKNLGI